MSEIEQIEKDLDAYLAPSQPDDCSPAHDAWVRAQLRATLAKKDRGEATYTDLEEVMREFGFDAR